MRQQRAGLTSWRTWRHYTVEFTQPPGVHADQRIRRVRPARQGRSGSLNGYRPAKSYVYGQESSSPRAPVAIGLTAISLGGVGLGGGGALSVLLGAVLFAGAALTRLWRRVRRLPHQAPGMR